MPEQFELDFNVEPTREELIDLSHEELYKLYQEKHGRDIMARPWSKDRIVDGILRSKEEEVDVVRSEDSESDKDELGPYKRRR